MSGTDQGPRRAQLRLLGGFDLHSGEGRAAIPAGRKVRALLACLALSPEQAWPREKLMALLWSDRGDEQARASLRQALAEMRRVLGEPSPVHAEHDAVGLDPALLAVDALEFERLAKAGKWAEAAALYRGPLLDGHGVRDGAFEDWIRVERTRLHDLAVDVLERLVGKQTGEAAIATAQRLLQLDPAREETHRLLMRLYAAAGQRAQALRQYDHCRDVLERELQAKPDAETERLHRQIQSETMPAPAARTGAARPDPASRAEDRPSIAVLPFTNMSGDPAQDYFSDGITEDIITELSRFRFLFVIARNSSFAYKGQATDVREIARQLGVRYVVEGSIRRAGNRVRVTAQLIEAASGSHLWAERYDRELDDIFLVQDEIAQRIVTSVAPRIEAEGIDLAKRKPPEDMRAYDYYLRAKALFGWPRDGADLRQARAYCDRAIAIDPSYARAHAQKAFAYVLGLVLMDADDVAEWRRQGVACAETAVALDPMDGFCHWALGEAAFQAGDHHRALDHMARALAINPNDADVLAVSSYLRAYTGDAEGGLRQMDMALELNPTTPSWYHWLRGVILYVLGRFEEALRALNLHSPANPAMLRTRAATLVELGRIDEARADIAALLAMQPGAAISQIKRYLDSMPDLDRHLDNLRRAGLPE
jgi:TolB-like protein/Flp pilus assembly protein TadD